MHRLIDFLINIQANTGMAESIPDSIRVKAEMPSFGFMFLRLIIALIVIIALIYLLSFIFKKISKHGIVTNSIDKEARLLGSFSLNSKQVIYIVYLFEEILLIGASQEQVTLLSKITDDDKIKKILARKRDNESLNFGNLLEKIKGKKIEE